MPVRIVVIKLCFGGDVNDYVDFNEPSYMYKIIVHLSRTHSRYLSLERKVLA